LRCLPEHKAVTAALNSPLGCERPAEMPGLEQNKRKMEDTKMRNTGLKFTWENGSKNSNAINIFKENGINWEYNHFGNLTADFYGIGIFEKVDYKHLENDDFEICIV